MSMDARHMGAWSGTLGDSWVIISTRFGTLGNCWFYQSEQIIRPLGMPGGFRDTSIPMLEYSLDVNLRMSKLMTSVYMHTENIQCL